MAPWLHRPRAGLPDDLHVSHGNASTPRFGFSVAHRLQGRLGPEHFVSGGVKLTKAQQVMLDSFAPARNHGHLYPDRYVLPKARRTARALCDKGLLRDGFDHWYVLTDAGRDALSPRRSGGGR
jgi:hypothetical protein